MLTSIIVPTLNEEVRIENTLLALERLRGHKELIVADGGSSDATVEIAGRHALVVHAERGRGAQMRQAANVACGDVLWFVHADTVVPPHALDEIERSLKRDEVAGGNFALHFDGASAGAKKLTAIYPVLRLLGLCYGDSGLFVRRSVYEQVGGMQPYELFEDLDLVRRIRRAGRFVHLPCTLSTSSRRFEQRNFAAMWCEWTALQVLFWLGVPPNRLASWYYPRKLGLLVVMSLLLSPRLIALDHSAWNSILNAYVTPDHLVDYAKLKSSDAARLDHYLESLVGSWPTTTSPDERKAALINAYNAHTIRWILAYYPVESIWRTKRPFREARHKLNGKAVSLDDIETELRSMDDPRIHAALVCAARSCPPLRREAYVGDRIDAQLEENTRAWLEDPKLNSFDADSGRAQISKIFDWYKADFNKSGGVAAFLTKYGKSARNLSYKSYRWGLNDSGGRGESYSGFTFYRDYLRNK